MSTSTLDDRKVLRPSDLESLIALLHGSGFEVIAPTLRDGAIVHDVIETAADLPAGWADEQDAGRYRLHRRSDGALFGYAAGPHSFRRFVTPPSERLLRIRRGAGSIEVGRDEGPPLRRALLGVRACDLSALAVQDRVFLYQPHSDPGYRARREAMFVVAVDCGSPSGCCFCASMGTGPEARSGYDLALTELIDGDHRILVRAGTPQGEEILASLPGRPAGPADLEAASAATAGAAAAMKRTMETDGLADLLLSASEHPRWRETGSRCLACANCTMVCPTCFCTTVEDGGDLAGESAERWRRWDSCFTYDFSYLHGGSVRTSGAARYRQWLTHKLGSWRAQFGTPGCVGCGRCITWCPVGIDLTEEVRAIRESPGRRGEEP